MQLGVNKPLKIWKSTKLYQKNNHAKNYSCERVEWVHCLSHWIQIFRRVSGEVGMILHSDFCVGWVLKHMFFSYQVEDEITICV